jgi:CBS domain containing-hemolysin-like protein
MSGTVGNVFLILLFVVIGGIFSASEIALVSLRDAQVRRLAEQGKRGQHTPERGFQAGGAAPSRSTGLSRA